MSKKNNLISIRRGTYVEYYPNEKDRIICAVVKYADNDEVASRGFSKCQENDVFDLDFGKKIAKYRAYSKLGEKYIKNLYGKIDELQKEMNEYYEIINTIDEEVIIYNNAESYLIYEKYNSDAND